jgi:hypothetical protein
MDRERRTGGGLRWPAGLVASLIVWALAPVARADCPPAPATVDLSGEFALCVPASPGYPAGTPVAMRVGLPDGTLLAGAIGKIGRPVRVTVPAGVLAPRADAFEVELVSMVRGIESPPRKARAIYRRH